MKKFWIILGICSVFQGCTAIQQPVATRQLVEDSTTSGFPTVAAELNQLLSNQQENSSVIWEGQTAMLGKRFFSATGKTCRKVTIEQLGDRVFCQGEDNQWFTVQPVLAEYQSEQVSGGK